MTFFVAQTQVCDCLCLCVQVEAQAAKTTLESVMGGAVDAAALTTAIERADRHGIISVCLSVFYFWSFTLFHRRQHGGSQ